MNRRQILLATAITLFLIWLLTFFSSCTTGPGGPGLFQQQAIVTSNELGQLATNYIVAVNPAVNRTLQTAQEVTAPWSPIVAAGLGILSAILAAIARAKTKQAALVPPLIDGVEAAGNVDVKKRIEKIAKTYGVQDRLHREVQRLTK